MINTPFLERNAEYYDRMLARGEVCETFDPILKSALHYLGSMQDPRVLELGCGTGQMATRIQALNIPYRGFDFSQGAIDHCHKNGVDLVSLGNAYDPAVYEPPDFNVILALEFFEHVDDLRVISEFPPGCQVLFSVPDFVKTTHLRAYQNPQTDIVEYYADFMAVKQVTPLALSSIAGTTLTIYMVHAVVAPAPIMQVPSAVRTVLPVKAVRS